MRSLKWWEQSFLKTYAEVRINARILKLLMWPHEIHLHFNHKKNKADDQYIASDNNKIIVIFRSRECIWIVLILTEAVISQIISNNVLLALTHCNNNKIWFEMTNQSTQYINFFPSGNTLDMHGFVVSNRSRSPYTKSDIDTPNIK